MPEEASHQRERVERIAREIDPGCDVDFILIGDGMIRFRVFERSGEALIERRGSWQPERLASMTDQTRRNF